MSETVYDILRTVDIVKNAFTQEEWIEFVDLLEVMMESEEE